MFGLANLYVVFAASGFLQDSNEQGQAQYGRILFPATHRVLEEILQVKQTDVFVDLGCGIG